MKVFIFTAVIGIFAQPAFASEVWLGRGVISDVETDQVSEYNLRVDIDDSGPTTAEHPGKKVVIVTITDDAGQVISTERCVQQSGSDHSWQKNCTNGTSKGYIMKYGLGVDYYETKSGKNYSTTIVLDSEYTLVGAPRRRPQTSFAK